MKRLLIPFIALAVTACGNNDIIVTSEVGEKMIVERDTIELRDPQISAHKSSLQKLIRSTESLAKWRCGDDTRPEKCWSTKKQIQSYKHELSLYQGKPWIQEWRYLPVHRDRNGTETVQKEAFIQCYSPDLTETDWKLLNQSDNRTQPISRQDTCGFCRPHHLQRVCQVGGE